MTPVDQYIQSKPKSLSEVLDFLNEQILFFEVGIKSSIKWGVPYYSKKRSICYLNVVKGKEVELNFTKGNLFDPVIREELRFYGRTVVGGVRFKNLEEIDVDSLNYLLAEAMRIDNR